MCSSTKCCESLEIHIESRGQPIGPVSEIPPGVGKASIAVVQYQGHAFSRARAQVAQEPAVTADVRCGLYIARIGVNRNRDPGRCADLEKVRAEVFAGPLVPPSAVRGHLDRFPHSMLSACCWCEKCLWKCSGEPETGRPAGKIDARVASTDWVVRGLQEVGKDTCSGRTMGGLRRE